MGHISNQNFVQGIFFEMMLAITNIKWYYETADKVKRLEDGMKADYRWSFIICGYP